LRCQSTKGSIRLAVDLGNACGLREAPARNARLGTLAENRAETFAPWHPSRASLRMVRHSAAAKNRQQCSHGCPVLVDATIRARQNVDGGCSDHVHACHRDDRADLTCLDHGFYSRSDLELAASDLQRSAYRSQLLLRCKVLLPDAGSVSDYSKLVIARCGR